MNLLEQFGREKFGDKFIRAVYPGNQPFCVIEFYDSNGNVDAEGHSVSNLKKEYENWKTRREFELSVGMMMD